jgi:hypothetical protein
LCVTSAFSAGAQAVTQRGAESGELFFRQEDGKGACLPQHRLARKQAGLRLISVPFHISIWAQKFYLACLPRKNKGAWADRCVLIFAYFLSRKSRKEHH